MIIGLAGRKNCGKTTLASECVNKLGFEQIAIADPLKKLISSLIGFDITSEQKSKNKIVNKKLSDEDIIKISDKTGIEKTLIKNAAKEKTMETVRDMLQFIGTDIIRKYNNDWHVNETLSNLKSSKSYVVDDVRFKNEKDAIEKMNGNVWFVVRPIIDGISNHESETSIKYTDCGTNLIINDIPLNSIKKKWIRCLTSLYFGEKTFRIILGCNTLIDLRKKLINLLKEKTQEEISDESGINISEINMFINNLLIPYPYYFEDISKFDYKMFTDLYKDNFKMIGKNLTAKQNGKRFVITDNPLIIENLKLFL